MAGATAGEANGALHPHIVAMEERKNDADRRRHLELAITEALHEAIVKNMHRLRALRLERDQKAKGK